MGKWIKCKKCSHEYHSSLPRCPECGNTTITLKGIVGIIAIVLFCLIVIAGIILGLNDDGIKTKPTDEQSASSSDVTPADSSSSTDTQSNSSTNEETDTSTPSVSSNTSSSSNNTVSTQQSGGDSTDITLPSIGTKTIGDYAYTTIPKYYLDYSYKIYKNFYPETSFNDYAYKLNDEQKANHTIEIIKNNDGSATHKAPKAKLSERVVISLKALIEVRADLKKQDYISDIEQNNTSDITVTLAVDELEDIQKYNIVMLGLMSFEHQLFSVSQNTASIIIKYPNGNEEILKLPDDIK